MQKQESQQTLYDEFQKPLNVDEAKNKFKDLIDQLRFSEDEDDQLSVKSNYQGNDLDETNEERNKQIKEIKLRLKNRNEMIQFH